MILIQGARYGHPEERENGIIWFVQENNGETAYCESYQFPRTSEKSR